MEPPGGASPQSRPAALCGDGLWCGIDLACYPSGVLDTFRLPKFSYYFFQSQRDPNLILPGIDCGPMVFVANYWTAASPTTVRVFSNCQQVRLYVNDVLRETRTPDAGYPAANLLHRRLRLRGWHSEPGELRRKAISRGSWRPLIPCSRPDCPILVSSMGRPKGCLQMAQRRSSSTPRSRTTTTRWSPRPPTRSPSQVAGPATLVSLPAVNAEAGIATAMVRVSDQPGQVRCDRHSGGPGGGCGLPHLRIRGCAVTLGPVKGCTGRLLLVESM